jgi:hypothetical protein
MPTDNQPSTKSRRSLRRIVSALKIGLTLTAMDILFFPASISDTVEDFLADIMEWGLGDVR